MKMFRELFRVCFCVDRTQMKMQNNMKNKNNNSEYGFKIDRWLIDEY